MSNHNFAQLDERADLSFCGSHPLYILQLHHALLTRTNVTTHRLQVHAEQITEHIHLETLLPSPTQKRVRLTLVNLKSSLTPATDASLSLTESLQIFTQV